MELKQLRYFKHVAEMGSFSHAALFLSVAQPALSRQVRKLEVELDTRLLTRNGRGVTTTEAGALLLTRATAILDQCNKAVIDVASIGEVISGRITLGLTPTVSQVLIRPLIAKLRARHPKLALEVVEGFSGHVNEWLTAGRLDVGVLNNAPQLRHLSVEDLFVEELYLVNPPTGEAAEIDTVQPRELENVPLILPSQPHGLRLLVDRVAVKCGLSLKIDYEINALSTIKDLVADGAGSTMLPYAAVHDEVVAGRISAQRIAGTPFSQTVVLATSNQRPPSIAVLELLNCIREEVAALHASGDWRGTVIRG